MHLYIHIPFCKQACHYCDFHFSTNLSQKSALVDAIGQELVLQKDYLPTTHLDTIYFGGGTPSLLTESELGQLFDAIHRQFTVSPTAEITLEANPDDLTADKLTMLRHYVNRLSIGLQTFSEETLRWMNRAHTATEAGQCVRLAREAGFDNLSIDLIYGIPDLTRPVGPIWLHDLDRALLLDVPHISAYALTIEPDTAFGRWTQKGQLKPIDENLAADQFEQLSSALRGAGYDHYEISNFAKPGHYARHNTAYWQQQPYLGLGPSAHSYNGHSRQFNVANNTRYVQAIAKGGLPAEIEILTTTDRVNEYLLTGLRTQWGCSLTQLNTLLGADFVDQQTFELADLYQKNWLHVQNGHLLLTEPGKLFADRVAASLFV
ncbi:MAG: radical SAM family heme chaperone HemW [Rudanella sp.]|nr:radical SAM family heme chaperone HemW [Rudanella sp.]